MLRTTIIIRFLVALIVPAFLSQAFAQDSDDGVRQVNHVRWYKKQAVDFSNTANQSAPNNSASLIFVRTDDADSVDTSANIAVNGRFQTSLQAGKYSQVYSCSGVNYISVLPTQERSNDLQFDATPYQLSAGYTYFFLVDVDNSGRAQITGISRSQAEQYFARASMQTHQISRVVPNCPPAPARIELKILFDNDKHFVKQQYYSEIETVAGYLRQYPNTTVTLEGHTDSNASEQYNINLSQRRVNAVRDVLIQHYGISPARISAVGYGESQPIASNNTAAGRQQNRRVIAVFQN